MYHRKFFVWFAGKSRWVPASEIGATVMYLDHGREVVYGRLAPHRAGCDHAGLSAVDRSLIWTAFKLNVSRHSYDNHSTGSTPVPC